MITGRYLDGRSAASTEAMVQFEGAFVQVLGLEAPLSIPLAEVQISERIANIPRRLTFAGGAVFETADNDGIDAACVAAGIKLRAGLVHWLESRWPVALASMTAVVLVAFGLVRWGIPAVTHWVARGIPASLDTEIGRGTLGLFDQYFFTNSRLDPDRQTELWMKFMDMTSSLDDGHRYALELRDGGSLGANAFALPSGIVVMTDEMVLMAESDEELLAVMAHEVGHVRGRHALRQMLQAAGISSLSMALFGDVGSVTSVLGAVPVLITASHSRDFEKEADLFARQWLREHDIAESNFDAILCRMDDESEVDGALSYFSTHPPIEERARCTPTATETPAN